MKIQQKLIAQLDLHHPKRSDLINALREVLPLSDSAIYRRLRSASAFTIDELEVIIHHFGLDLQDLFGLDTAPFDLNHSSTPEIYINRLLKNWTSQVEHLVAQTSPVVFMTTSTLPFSLAMEFTELVKYRLYYMLRHLKRYPEMRTLAFDPRSPLYRQVSAYSDRIHHAYKTLPITEIWSPMTFHSTIKQMSWLHHNQQLTTEHFLLLLNQLEQLAKQCATYAKHSSKETTNRMQLNSLSPDYLLYLNETSTVEEFTMLSWYEQRQPHTYIYHPVYGITSDPQPKWNIESYFLALKESSILISTTNGAVRNAFFRKVKTAIEKKRRELE